MYRERSRTARAPTSRRAAVQRERRSHPPRSEPSLPVHPHRSPRSERRQSHPPPPYLRCFSFYQPSPAWDRASSLLPPTGRLATGGGLTLASATPASRVEHLRFLGGRTRFDRVP